MVKKYTCVVIFLLLLSLVPIGVMGEGELRIQDVEFDEPVQPYMPVNYVMLVKNIGDEAIKTGMPTGYFFEGEELPKSLSPLVTSYLGARAPTSKMVSIKKHAISGEVVDVLPSFGEIKYI